MEVREDDKTPQLIPHLDPGLTQGPARSGRLDPNPDPSARQPQQNLLFSFCCFWGFLRLFLLAVIVLLLGAASHLHIAEEDDDPERKNRILLIEREEIGKRIQTLLLFSEMSHSGKPISEQLGLDSFSDRFCDSLSCEANKPDFRELDLGSPVSPLRTRQNGGIATATSSSSSSSGSVSGRIGPNQVARRVDSAPNNHSGELSGSSESSPTTGRSWSIRRGAPTCKLHLVLKVVPVDLQFMSRVGFEDPK